jgi:hypothetical protein
VSAAEAVDASAPRDSIKNSARTKDGCVFSYARGIAQYPCAPRERIVQRTFTNNAHNHTNPPRCTGLSVSGVVFVGFSLQPLSRTDGAMRNKAARRQRPYACIRNALTTTDMNTLRSTFSSNVSLTSSLLRATEHHVTGAIDSTAGANFDPTIWARKAPAMVKPNSWASPIVILLPARNPGVKTRLKNGPRKTQNFTK